MLFFNIDTDICILLHANRKWINNNNNNNNKNNKRHTEILLEFFFIVAHCNIIRVSWDIEKQKLGCRKKGQRNNGNKGFKSYQYHYNCLVKTLNIANGKSRQIKHAHFFYMAGSCDSLMIIEIVSQTDLHFNCFLLSKMNFNTFKREIFYRVLEIFGKFS